MDTDKIHSPLLIELDNTANVSCSVFILASTVDVVRLTEVDAI